MKPLVSSSLRFIALGGLLFLTTASIRAEVDELRVSVRPSVEYKGIKKPTDAELQEAKTHQRIYVLAHMEGLNGFEKLVRPVNEPALAAEVRKTLAANGYIEAAAHGPKPEIVLSVYYGRGWPPNIYLGDAQEIPSGVDSTPAYNLDVPNYKDNPNSSGPGHDEKAARASYEKLMILITAVKYPAKPLQPGEKLQRLWKTLMIVDDPDHRDLNNVMQEMLAAGGAFFGQQSETEAEVWKPLPEGRVILGETKVLEEVKSAPKK